MKLFIIGEYYPPLRSWLEKDEPPSGVPAVHALFVSLGRHREHKYHAHIFTRDLTRTITLPNGSTICLQAKHIPGPYLFWKAVVFLSWWIYGPRIIKPHNPDVLYAQGSWVVLGRRLGKKLGIPSVSRIYGTILTDIIQKRKWFSVYTRNILEIMGIRYPCDMTICTNDGTDYDHIVAVYDPDRYVHMMYNGMGTQLRNQLTALPLVRQLRVPVRILYMARLEPYKRVHLAIKTISQLKKDFGVVAELRIVGSGSQLSSLNTFIDQLDLSEHVTIMPEVSHEAIVELLSWADISMMLYSGGSLGNVMWESCLAGRLIATVDNGSTASVLEHGREALVVPDVANLPQIMAASIAKLQPDQIERMTTACRQKITNLITDWDSRIHREMSWIVDQLSKTKS